MHRGHKLADGVHARGGHLEGGACLHAGNVVVRATPVRHHGAVEAPLAAQDVTQQVAVLIGVSAVDQVVGAHDRLGVGLSHHNLEGREVVLAQGALVDHRVGRLAARLLTVGSKVLGAGGNALGLDAAHVGRGHLACKVGILGEVLKVTPAERRTLHAQARPQKRAHALGRGLLAQRLANLLAQRLVPGVGNRDRRGEASGRLGARNAQVVCRAQLVAQAIGAVRELHGRNAQALRAPAPKGRGPLEKRALLLQRHLPDKIRVLHRTRSLVYMAPLTPSSETTLLPNSPRREKVAHSVCHVPRMANSRRERPWTCGGSPMTGNPFRL